MNENKLLIRKYNSSKELEDFFNDFSNKHKVISREVRIIPFEGRIFYFLVLEY